MRKELRMTKGEKFIIFLLICIWLVAMWIGTVPDVVKKDITETVENVLTFILIAVFLILYMILQLVASIIEKAWNFLNKDRFKNNPSMDMHGFTYLENENESKFTQKDRR